MQTIDAQHFFQMEACLYGSPGSSLFSQFLLLLCSWNKIKIMCEQRKVSAFTRSFFCLEFCFPFRKCKWIQTTPFNPQQHSFYVSPVFSTISVCSDRTPFLSIEMSSLGLDSHFSELPSLSLREPGFHFLFMLKAVWTLEGQDGNIMSSLAHVLNRTEEENHISSWSFGIKFMFKIYVTP